jgi:cytochrome d ubiquinol oxidase subunit II
MVMLENIIAVVTLASLILYVLLAGADFGGGFWDLFATGKRAERQRHLISEAIAPIWEANHVWLILVIVLLFTAWPRAFGWIMTALHLPLTAMLIGIVLRGTAFVFRKYEDSEASIRRWNFLFGVSSLVTPFIQGMCLGALACGSIRVSGNIISTGFFAGWTGWFAIACGGFALGLGVFLAAVYLTVDAQDDPEVQNDFRRRALLSEVALAYLAAGVFFAARQGAPEMYHQLTRWWAPVLLVWTSGFAVLALVALMRRWYRWARVAAVGQVTMILVGWSIAQFPQLIVPDVDIHENAAPEATLRLLLIALGLGALILFPSLYFLFRIFKGGRTAQSPASETKR